MPGRDWSVHCVRVRKCAQEHVLKLRGISIGRGIRVILKEYGQLVEWKCIGKKLSGIYKEHK